MALGQILFTLGRLQRLAEQLLHVLRPDPLAPARHRGRIERQFVNEILKAAEVLPIAVFQQASDNRFVALVEGVLQIMQTDHQPRRLAGAPPLFSVEGAKFIVKDRPVDLIRQNKQTADASGSESGRAGSGTDLPGHSIAGLLAS